MVEFLEHLLFIKSGKRVFVRISATSFPYLDWQRQGQLSTDIKETKKQSDEQKNVK